MQSSIDLATVFTAHGLPRPLTEHGFHPTRLWRFDYAWPAWRVAVERQGGTWTAGRHSHAAGYRNDAEKLAEAQILGWLVVYVTADMLRDGSAFALTRRALETRGWMEVPGS